MKQSVFLSMLLFIFFLLHGIYQMAVGSVPFGIVELFVAYVIRLEFKNRMAESTLRG